MSARFSKAALRGLRARERITAMQTAAQPDIRVVPADDDGRRLLKHPKGGGFPAGGAEWPDDRFTKRRLADGSVTREVPPEPEGRENERRKPDKGDQRDEPDHAA